MSQVERLREACAEICIRYADLAGKRETAEREAGNEAGAAFESGAVIAAMNLASLITRTPVAPPSDQGEVAQVDRDAAGELWRDLEMGEIGENNGLAAVILETMALAFARRAALKPEALEGEGR